GLTRDGFFMRLPPDGRFDFQAGDFAKTYPPNQVRPVDLTQLHQVLLAMPCCTTGASGKEQGDPVNFVLVGSEDDVMGALTQQGWDPTHTIDQQSVRKTIGAFLLGKRYRYSPVSRLFFFKRGQDLAMQKVRRTIHQRNHLRLWRAPYRYQTQD